MNKPMKELTHRFVEYKDLPKFLKFHITDRGEGFRYSDEKRYLKEVERYDIGDRNKWDDGDFTAIHCLTPSGTVLAGIAVYTTEYDRYGNDITSVNIPKALTIAADRLEKSLEVYIKRNKHHDDFLDAIAFGVGNAYIQPIMSRIRRF